MLWEAKNGKQPIVQMTGHSKLINIVSFSPDGNLIASAAFDKNIRVWTCKGKYGNDEDCFLFLFFFLLFLSLLYDLCIHSLSSFRLGLDLDSLADS
jgi:WD40 repeat protein